MRRRRKFTWFPTLGTAEAGGLPDQLNGRTFSVVVAAGAPGAPGPITTLIFPVVPDEPLESTQAAQAGGLVLNLGQEYFLERLVGKCFVGLKLNDTPGAVNNVLVGAGFFIARVNEPGFAGGADQPIGSASAVERNLYFSPLNNETVREPWIWRRTWLLSGVTDPDNGFTNFPTANSFYGSVSDGPHIDAKSVRRVSQEERLFFAVSGATLRSGNEGQTANTVNGYLDLRVLGALRKARGKSTF